MFFGFRGIFLALVLLGLPGLASADEPAVEFSIHTEIAQVDGEAVVSPAWVAEQIAAANAIFAPTDVGFVSGTQRATDVAANLVTRTDRHRLGPRVDPSSGAIHLFIVESMEDVDVPGRPLRGVHWRSRRGGGPRHFVVLTSIAGPNTLAHELGHFFGNPHSPTPGNIMSYTRGEGPPFFDRPQQSRIRRFARRFVESGELRPTQPAGAQKAGPARSRAPKLRAVSALREADTTPGIR